MANIANPRINPCVSIEIMKKPGRVRDRGGGEKIVWICEELNSIPTPLQSVPSDRYVRAAHAAGSKSRLRLRGRFGYRSASMEQFSGQPLCG